MCIAFKIRIHVLVLAGSAYLGEVLKGLRSYAITVIEYYGLKAETCLQMKHVIKCQYLNM